MPATRRPHDDAAASLEHELVVRPSRVEAGLGPDRPADAGETSRDPFGRAGRDGLVGRARVVRVHDRPRLVQSGLQANPRRDEGIPRDRLHGGVEHGWERFVGGEVGARLPRWRSVHSHERRSPGARRHDCDAGPQATDGDRVSVLLHRLDARLLTELGTGVERAASQRRDRVIGEHDAAVALEEAARARLDANREPAADLRGVEHLRLLAARGERPLVGLPVAEVERAVQFEQRPAGFGLERAPERIRLLREPHPARLGIGETDDPRSAVARAAIVSDRELLADDDVATRLGERPCRREPHHAGADDDDLGLDLSPRSRHRRSVTRARRSRAG